MNYPIQSLAILAPIIFLLLMIAVPVIGVFAGWKRAAYWGGGTFFFFLLGVIIWKTAGASIVNPLMGLIENLLKDLGATPTTQLVTSLTSPIFFLLVMAVAELVLLINYYAWFKRVAKIKQDIKAKKEYKALKKAGKAVPKKLKGWTAMQFTAKGKVINMACGGAGMALLLAPSTVTFTQAIMYATTSASTRANNSFCSALYNSLQQTAQAFDWMSYYGNGDTAKDFDSLFATLEMTSTQTNITYYDYSSGTAEEKTISGTVSDVLVNVVKDGFGGLIKQTQSSETTKTDIKNSVKTFASAWNNLLEQNPTSITSFFQSNNVTAVLEGVIGKQIGESEKTEITPSIVDQYFGEGSIFDQVVSEYTSEEWEGEKLQPITVDQNVFNNILNSVNGLLNTTSLEDTPEAEIFNTKLNTLISIMFQVA